MVYDQTVSSMQLLHTVPAGSITNGACYNAVAYVYESDGVESTESSPIIFYCFTTPVFVFTNLSQDDVIRNSTFSPQLSYSQPEGELLNSYQITLYNDAGSELRTTGMKYDTSLTATFTGLSESVSYKVRGVGETINGMKIDTGMVSFSVHYLQPSIYSRLLLKNDEKNGVIEYVSNIISIEGVADPAPATYLGGDMVDVRAGGSTVTFDEGFSLADNYTIRCTGGYFPYNIPLLNMSYQTDTITLCLRKSIFAEHDGEERSFFELTVGNGPIKYQTYGDLMEIVTDNPMFFIWIRCVDGCYTVRSSVMGEVGA